MHYIQGVSPLTVIYNIQNTQIWVITQENFFTFHYHRKKNFSFEGESGHFKSHIVSKNVELSEIDNYFIITKMLTLMLPFLWNVGLKAYFFDSFSLVQLKMVG